MLNSNLFLFWAYLAICHALDEVNPHRDIIVDIAGNLSIYTAHFIALKTFHKTQFSELHGHTLLHENEVYFIT